MTSILVLRLLAALAAAACACAWAQEPSARALCEDNGIALSPDEKRLYVSDYATNRIIVLPLGQPGVLSPTGVPSVFASLHGGTEAGKNDIWRVKTRFPGL